MATLLAEADLLLRGRALGNEAPRAPALRTLVALVMAFGLWYGAVMGAFAGFSPERLLQVAYSAVKVPLLLLVTFAIALPSFFVINSLYGLREDFGAATRALVATQAALTIILSSLAPFTALWYASSDDYRMAILFNAAMFAVASVAAQFTLRRLYRPLIERNARHRAMLRVWLVVYAFVGVELGWLLRPFIGDPRGPVQFFRDDALGNAYEVVARMIWEVVSR